MKTAIDEYHNRESDAMAEKLHGIGDGRMDTQRMTYADTRRTNEQ